MPFQALMQLHRGLEQQEQAAEQHDQVAPRERFVEDFEQRLRQRDHPRDAGQQAQAHDQGQRQADDSGTVALLRRQFVGEDGDKHQVINTQYQFQHNQGQQAEPGRGICNPFHRYQSISRRCWVNGERAQTSAAAEVLALNRGRGMGNACSIARIKPGASADSKLRLGGS